MMLVGSSAIRALRDLIQRQGIVDLHRPGDILPRPQTEARAALQVAERQAPSPGNGCSG